jgi:quercetin dioxygenase-like cupin family protein
MGNITHIKDLDMRELPDTAPGKDVKEIFNSDRRRILDIALAGGSVLSKHKADEPITVLCLSGTGTFRAGRDLEESQKLVPGTLITLETGIEHDVTAEPAIRILVTRFKDQ